MQEVPLRQRRTAREWALQMIVQADLNPFVNCDMILSHFWEQQLSIEQEANGEDESAVAFVVEDISEAEMALRAFTEVRVRGVLSELDDLDAIIANYCENWSLQRLGVIERCVLRLAIYEMRKLKTPAPVMINEAIDLAKYFSNAESGAFVNGVLDRFAKDEAKR